MSSCPCERLELSLRGEPTAPESVARRCTPRQSTRRTPRAPSTDTSTWRTRQVALSERAGSCSGEGSQRQSSATDRIESWRALSTRRRPSLGSSPRPPATARRTTRNSLACAPPSAPRTRQGIPHPHAPSRTARRGASVLVGQSSSRRSRGICRARPSAARDAFGTLATARGAASASPR